MRSKPFTRQFDWWGDLINLKTNKGQSLSELVVFLKKHARYLFQWYTMPKLHWLSGRLSYQSTILWDLDLKCKSIANKQVLKILNKHVHTPIYSQEKKFHSRAFFAPNKIWKFTQKCIFTYKRWIKPSTKTFIQDHTIIWITRVGT